MDEKRVLKSIPRPLRNMMDQLSSSSTANQSGEGVSSGALFQPNKLAFRDLVEKSGRRHGLEYALKVTSTPIPEHIQCGICQGVARNAMLLPWDPEGRTACEICIREGLARNGFLRCPLTGEEGVSPDDLHPNAGLRKAADLFVESVMERVDEIENQSADDEESAVGISDGAVAEHGNVGSKMMTTVSRKEPEDENGPFGFGGDEFGGDVFAVEEADQKVKARKVTEEPKSPIKSVKICKHNRDKMIENVIGHAVKSVVNDLSVRTEGPAQLNDRKAKSSLAQKEGMSSKSNDWDRRERRRRRHRGPPPGYAIGPAQGRPYQTSSGNIGGRRNQNYCTGGERPRGRFAADANSTRSSGKKRSHDEHFDRSRPLDQQPSRIRICNRESGYQRYGGYRGGPRDRSYGRVDYHRGSNNDR